MCVCVCVWGGCFGVGARNNTLLRRNRALRQAGVCVCAQVPIGSTPSPSPFTAPSPQQQRNPCAALLAAPASGSAAAHSRRQQQQLIHSPHTSQDAAAVPQLHPQQQQQSLAVAGAGAVLARRRHVVRRLLGGSRSCLSRALRGGGLRRQQLRHAPHQAPGPARQPKARHDDHVSLTAGGAAQPAKALCPGVTYDLVVGYGAERRRTFITASAGKFGSPGSLAADATCPNRAASSGGATGTYSNTLTLPCDAKGPSVQLKVTSAGKAVDSFHTAVTTLPLSPIADCPGSTCPGAPAAAAAAAPAAAKAAAPAPAAAAVSEPKAAAPAADKAAAAAGSGGSCAPSSFGYACSTAAGDGATLHQTLSDSATPPDNACTAAAVGAASPPAAGAGQWLHLLLESPLRGYSGLSFPQTPGRMYPADAVIGYSDPASGKPMVSAHHLTDYSPSPSSVNGNSLGWASRMAAVPAAAGGNGGSLLCFSRPLAAPAAAVSKTLDPKALNLNWVSDGGTSLRSVHSLTGSLLLNAADGSSAVTHGTGGKGAAQVAHGALMLLAFVVFMPAGALLARHKWLFGDKQASSIRGSWFQGHRAVQALAVALAVAGFILALVKFNVPWSNMSDEGAAPHKAYNAHRVLGVIAIGFTVLQACGGFIRPGLVHGKRRLWRGAHQGLGWLTIATGVATVLLGCVLMHDMAGASHVAWLLPVLLLLGLALVAGLVAELGKRKLQRAGRYDPHTHSYSSVSGGAAAAAAAMAAKQRGDGSSSAGAAGAHNGAGKSEAAVSAANGLGRGNSHSHIV